MLIRSKTNEGKIQSPSLAVSRKNALSFRCAVIAALFTTFLVLCIFIYLFLINVTKSQKIMNKDKMTQFTKLDGPNNSSEW